MNKTIDEQILEQIRPYITDKLDVLPDDVTLEADLSNDLGADSLDTIEIIMEFERKFSCRIPEEQQEKIRTIGDVIDNVKITSTLDWIRNGQVQPAKETVAPKAAEPVQKPAIQKPSAANKRNYGTLTKVNFGLPGHHLFCGYMQESEVALFLQKLKKFDAGVAHCAGYKFDFFGDCGTKSDSTLMIDAINKTNNTYGIDPLCNVRTLQGCWRKLKRGECKDPFVIENIGKVFFPGQYEKRR